MSRTADLTAAVEHALHSGGTCCAAIGVPSGSPSSRPG